MMPNVTCSLSVVTLAPMCCRELCHGSQGKGWPWGLWCPLLWETSTLCIHLLMDFLALSSQAGKSWLQLQWKAVRAPQVLFDNPKGVAYSWSKCCRSPSWGLANAYLDRTRMSRGMNVPRHWVLVTRHKQVGAGESQRLLHDLIWPPIFSCFVSSCLLHTSWCAALGADVPPTKLFLQWLFTADASMCLVFFFLLAIFSPLWTVNYCTLTSF